MCRSPSPKDDEVPELVVDVKWFVVPASVMTLKRERDAANDASKGKKSLWATLWPGDDKGTAREGAAAPKAIPDVPSTPSLPPTHATSASPPAFTDIPPS